MALKNYTTSVDVTKTISDIHVMLAKSKARRIMFDYDDVSGRVMAICFQINGSSGDVAIRLPANVDRVHEVLKRQKRDTKNRAQINDTFEQAERVAWRIVKDWLDAQLALLETEMVDMMQVFLPYMINRHGQTVYELYQSGQLSLTD